MRFGAGAVLAAVPVWLAVAFGLRAQSQTTPWAPLTFEVASVKPSAACSPNCPTIIRATIGNQGYHAVDATLRLLMTVAYSVADRQISGGPKMTVHDPTDKDYPPTGFRPIPGNDGSLCFEMPARNITMTYFAFMLSRAMNRPVVDRTGLSARYDFSLRFVPDGLHVIGPNGSAAAISADCSDPFTALPKQLGLQLEAIKTPVEYLVVEGAEKPTEN